MMVIQGTSNLEDGGTPRLNIHPADRCTWLQGNSTGEGYSVSNVLFWSGAGGANAEFSVTNARLGFIGKSGRFVPISD